MLILFASLILVIRVWRQTGWELNGTLWGLLPVAAAFSLCALRQNLRFYWFDGFAHVNLLPVSLPLCLYACGIMLLFAGVRVARLAWFPLALLMFVQPVPGIGSQFVDQPLQALSAHVARSFASLIGFAPTSPQLLKLMFTPDFGMFIAPGCDGMRGAITLGYIALIVGYLKRVSIRKWFLYVIGAVLLGYLFNLLRLCALVVYYRIAVGHPALEHVAKQADYGIGACLILVAAVLFFWIATMREDSQGGMDKPPIPHASTNERDKQSIKWKAAALAVLTMFFAVPAAYTVQNRLHRPQGIGGLTPQQLNDLMPKQLGEYKLNRVWQEKLDGVNAMQCGAYDAPGSDEFILGVWLLPGEHSIHASWMDRGESPERHENRSFATILGRVIRFDSAFYSDGVTESLVGDTECTYWSCSPFSGDSGMYVAFRDFKHLTARQTRVVPIFFRVESLQTNQPKSATYQALSAEAQRFLSGVDFVQISQTFQQ